MSECNGNHRFVNLPEHIRICFISDSRQRGKTPSDNNGVQVPHSLWHKHARHSWLQLRQILASRSPAGPLKSKLKAAVITTSVSDTDATPAIRTTVVDAEANIQHLQTMLTTLTTLTISLDQDESLVRLCLTFSILYQTPPASYFGLYKHPPIRVAQLERTVHSQSAEICRCNVTTSPQNFHSSRWIFFRSHIHRRSSRNWKRHEMRLWNGS